MSLAETESFDLSARMASPLLATAEIRLAANVTAATMIGADCAAFALGDGTVRLRDVGHVDGRPSFGAGEIVATHHIGAATALLPLHDGCVSAGQDGRVLHYPGTGAGVLRLIDFAGRWVNALAVHEPGGLIAAAADRRVVVVDGRGQPTLECESFPSTVLGLSFAPEGRRIVAAHIDGLSVLSVDGGTREHFLKWKGSHIGVSWSPDGRYIVSTTQERELHVWDLVTLKDFRLGGYPHKIHGMHWLANGLILVCTGADVITAWSFAEAGPGNKPPIEIGYVYDGLVTAVAANPVRPIVAGGFSNGSLLIGGVSKGEALLARGNRGDPVTALAWSPDGSRLIAGTAAGNAIAVDLPDDLGIR